MRRLLPAFTCAARDRPTNRTDNHETARELRDMAGAEIRRSPDHTSRSAVFHSASALVSLRRLRRINSHVYVDRFSCGCGGILVRTWYDGAVVYRQVRAGVLGSLGCRTPAHRSTPMVRAVLDPLFCLWQGVRLSRRCCPCTLLISWTLRTSKPVDSTLQSRNCNIKYK